MFPWSPLAGPGGPNTTRRAAHENVTLIRLLANLVSLQITLATITQVSA
jgi:hypothetical protein